MVPARSASPLSHASGLPLQADLDEKVYKLLFLDVGLMNAICLLAESPNRELTYWLREGRSSHAEVDFVIAVADVVRALPPEVT